MSTFLLQYVGKGVLFNNNDAQERVETVTRIVRTIGLIVIGACVTGCKQVRAPKMVALFKAKPSLSPLEKVNLLRTEAKKRGIRWNIFCIPKSAFEDERYQADAFQDGDTGSRYVEDGAKDWWSETASTPEEAAYLLSISIQGPPELTADHKPAATSPGSCNFNTVLDSKHEGRIPCEK